MIAPSNRLILLAAAVALPLFTAAWVVPSLALGTSAVLAVLVVGAIIDAILGTRALSEVTAEFPPGARWTKDRESKLAIKLDHAPADLRIDADFPFPYATNSGRPEATPRSPADGAQPIQFLCTPTRRGDYQLTRCYLETPSPLRLWSIRSIRPIRTLIRVYPNLRHDKTAAAFLRRSLGGMHLQRQLGKGREFEKLRDYAPGDSFDEIHWKATARRGRPITKQFQIERTQEVYVVVDSSRLTARADALEQFVTAALVLAIAADRQGDHFGLLTFSDKVEQFVRARSGMSHFLACRNAIYDLQPRPVSPSFEEVFSFIQMRLQRRALLIFLTALDDPLLAETFSQHCGVIARRHLVIVATPQQSSAQPLFAGDLPAGTDEVYQRLASHLAFRDRTELKKKIERQGMKFAILRPENISADLAALYLSIKRSQSL
jgi:uncharacterized protein (DUF58 family)